MRALRSRYTVGQIRIDIKREVGVLQPKSRLTEARTCYRLHGLKYRGRNDVGPSEATLPKLLSQCIYAHPTLEAGGSFQSRLRMQPAGVVDKIESH